MSGIVIILAALVLVGLLAWYHIRRAEPPPAAILLRQLWKNIDNKAGARRLDETEKGFSQPQNKRNALI